jgi:hypothetical protein
VPLFFFSLLIGSATLFGISKNSYKKKQWRPPSKKKKERKKKPEPEE